jgi:3-hydroxyisobutyrate dehydrogenase-like beta-hydroxyacid dehydrogenase
MRVGVAGCGRMGLPMARALADAGHDVRGFDIRPPASFGDFAPRMAPDPSAFAAHGEVLISVVRDAAETESLLFGSQGLVRREPAARILVVCSTLSPAYVRALPPRLPAGLALVDAPMSGAQVAAVERHLAFMVGGPDEAVTVVEPLLAVMGRRVHRLGPTGAGMVAKVLNNFVAAAAVAATRRALDWGDRLGIDEEALLAVMQDSSGQTWFGSNFDRIEFARDGWRADNSIGLLTKDVECALDALAPADREGLAEAVIDAIRALCPRAQS